MKTIFYNKDLSLSTYSLICGYIFLYENEEKNIHVKLWLEGCYHVRYTNYNNTNLSYWKSFDTLTEAKKLFYESLKNDFNLSKKQAILKSCYIQK